MNNNRGSSIFSILILIVVAAGVYFIVQTVQQTAQQAQQALNPLQQANSSLQTQVSDMMHPTPTVIPDPVTYITQVRALARLETIQYSVEKVVTCEVNQGTFSFAFGDKVLFVGHGTVIAGIDMSNINPGDMQLANGVLTVKLPPPEIFIATLDNDKSYVYSRDTGVLVKAQNTADVTAALAQFDGKKPCWADEFSPSGYVVPLGFLGEAGVKTLEPAFVAGQPTVVRAVYAGGICDFGATYIDARAYPGLEDSFPDVNQKVMIVWQTPSIIPYEVLVYAHGMTVDMSRVLTRAFVDLMSTPDGSSAMQTLYGFNAMDVIRDGQYDEFRKAVKASGLDLNMLVR